MPMPVVLGKTDFPGVLEVTITFFKDERGFFTETYSNKVWEAAGFTDQFQQDCMSKSAKGVMRGMHYQLEPHGMGKLVRVITGAIFDVGVDLRKGSPTFGKWIGRTLTADNNLALYFPSGFAHGFVALEDNTQVYYKCTSVHAPEAERSLSYKDSAIGIEWPLTPTIVSKKDADAPTLEKGEYNFVFQA